MTSVQEYQFTLRLPFVDVLTFGCNKCFLQVKTVVRLCSEKVVTCGSLVKDIGSSCFFRSCIYVSNFFCVCYFPSFIIIMVTYPWHINLPTCLSTCLFTFMCLLGYISAKGGVTSILYLQPGSSTLYMEVWMGITTPLHSRPSERIQPYNITHIYHIPVNKELNLMHKYVISCSRYSGSQARAWCTPLAVLMLRCISQRHWGRDCEWISELTPSII